MCDVAPKCRAALTALSRCRLGYPPTRDCHVPPRTVLAGHTSRIVTSVPRTGSSSAILFRGGGGVEGLRGAHFFIGPGASSDPTAEQDTVVLPALAARRTDTLRLDLTASRRGVNGDGFRQCYPASQSVLGRAGAREACCVRIELRPMPWCTWLTTTTAMLTRMHLRFAHHIPQVPMSYQQTTVCYPAVSDKSSAKIVQGRSARVVVGVVGFGGGGYAHQPRARARRRRGSWCSSSRELRACCNGFPISHPSPRALGSCRRCHVSSNPVFRLVIGCWA